MKERATMFSSHLAEVADGQNKQNNKDIFIVLKCISMFLRN